MKSIEISSPAKINLRLDVLGRRPDGYHEIRTIFQKITLADELSISITKSGIEITCDNPQVPLNKENLTHVAAKMLLDRYMINDGIMIAIRKRIPIAAGLGGGSSNAASTLLGINQLFDLGIDKRELLKMGRNIGADVPFFIFGNSALATGIGEKLEPLEITPPLWLLLVTPDIPISTAWAYANVRRRLTKKVINITISNWINHLSEVIDLLKNDLEEVVIPHYPEIQSIKEDLLERGAMGSLMSGSGSTVFGIFGSEKEAQNAYSQLKNHRTWQVRLSQKK